MPTPAWFRDMLGWKPATDKTRSRCVTMYGVGRGPNLADLAGKGSCAITGQIYSIVGIPTTKLTTVNLDEEKPGSAGTLLERALETDIAAGLAKLAPDRGWGVTHQGTVGQFAQYTHLDKLQQLFDDEPTLRSAIGRDYHVSTDVMVSLPNPSRGDGSRVLHAAISSKLTIRSDRVQNIRYEFATLVRNRRGRLPHLVVVTAEPLPSRIISIARGLGEIDAVYHLLFDELQETVANPKLAHYRATDWRDQRRDWQELVDQERVKPYADLIAALASG